MSADAEPEPEAAAPAKAVTRQATPTEILLIRDDNIQEPFSREWIRHIESLGSASGQEILRLRKRQGPRLHEREPRTAATRPAA
ncbi:hypothetical protein NSI01_25950 [Pimelobacter simplex]|nr:hypothetical protein NSI01_25950 [Pimelobacter simplex]